MAFSRRILRTWRTQRRLLMLIAAGACGPFALAAVFPVLQACGPEDSTTGKRVILHTRIELESEELTTFDNGLDWHVTLQHAWIATGAFGYFDGVPPLVSRRSPTPEESWRLALERFLGVGVAHAHPGHYQAGMALGEMLEHSSVDILSGTTDLPDGDGVTGTYRSARFSFGSPPVGPFSGKLDGHAALLEGTAELDGEITRHFRAFADVAELAKIQAGGNIDGCPFDEVTVTADGTVTVRVDPSVWFDLVDFGELDPGSSDEPSEFPEGSQPRIAFAQGLAQLSAYRFSYSR
jgi:hypothetical protein